MQLIEKQRILEQYNTWSFYNTEKVDKNSLLFNTMSGKCLLTRHYRKSDHESSLIRFLLACGYYVNTGQTAIVCESAQDCSVVEMNEYVARFRKT